MFTGCPPAMVVANALFSAIVARNFCAAVSLPIA